MVDGITKPPSESAVRIYGNIPLSETHGKLGERIEEGLADSTTRPWIELGLRGLEKLASAKPSLLGGLASLSQRARYLGNLHKFGLAVEEDLSKSRSWLPLLMPAGTYFQDEEFWDSESSVARMLAEIRNWYRQEMTALGVEHPVFPQVLLFTPPKTPSSKMVLVLTVLGKEIPLAGIEDAVADNIATLEEGLALCWSERYRIEVLSQMFPKGHAFYQKMTAKTVGKHPELIETRFFYYPEEIAQDQAEEDRTISISINDYSSGGRMVEGMITDIPDFIRLVEQARVDGKTLALARAIEETYGRGSYRKFVTGVSSTSDFKVPTTTGAFENHVSGLACGDCILVEYVPPSQNIPDYLQELALYQMGMVMAEEVYHSLAPTMVHINTQTHRLDYRVERRGLNYSAARKTKN